MEFIDLKAQYRRIQPDVDARIHRVLEHAQFILGPEVTELELLLAHRVGVQHVIACASGTDALLMALMALNIGPGDEVITSPFTFAATVEMIALLGATPVYVDIDPATYNIDPAQIESAITAKTRAILPVSLYGLPADFDAINAIAARHHLPVIEDAAQSFGATYRGRQSCNLSTIGCTSFFPSKPLGCYGDGGACFTSDPELAAAMREIRVHGQDRRYHHIRIGINGRLDTIQAAVLLGKLAVFDEELELRSVAAARYAALLGGAIEPPILPDGCTSPFAQYTVEVDDRDRVQSDLAAAGIPSAVHYPIPAHLQPAFASSRYPAGSLPRAEAAGRRVLSLPMHPYIGETDQARVASALRAAVLATAGQQ